MGTVPINYSTSDPRKIASQQRQTIAQQGNALGTTLANNTSAARGNTSATANYLDSLETPLAQGQGGYTPDEASQIELSPQDKQNIIDNAGISAGVTNAAASNAAQQQFNATGGNPAALAAYNARATQQTGAATGDAMTNARVAAQQAGSAGTQAVGNAQIAQQNQGLQYFQGQNQQQNQNAQQDLALQEQNYGTESNAGNQASSLGVQASQTPSTFDKILGGVSGALPFLDDGDTSRDAVVGEAGPEKVVDMRPTGISPGGPAIKFMDDGDDQVDMDGAGQPLGAPSVNQGGQPGGPKSWWQKFTASQPSASVSYGTGQPPRQQWNPTTPYSQIGSLAGKSLGAFMDDGAVADEPAMSGGLLPSEEPQGSNGIFTKPTHVKMARHEAAIPLSYRPKAKMRPSMAAMPAAKPRHLYGAHV